MKYLKKYSIVLLVILTIAAPAFANIPEGNLIDGIQPGQDGKIDVLTVFAHQDDETIYGGGALFKMLKDPRVRLHILCMTLGDFSEAKDRLGITGEHLGKIRSQELETAAAVYGAVEVTQFQYHDAKLIEAGPDKAINEIKDVIDRVGAEIVFTHDPLGITGHNDHVTTSKLATEAFMRSSAQRLYYPTLPPYLYAVMKIIIHAKGKPEAAIPTIKVDISAEKKLKRMAFYAHASQEHFSGVGNEAKIVFMYDHEYFALGKQK